MTPLHTGSIAVALLAAVAVAACGGSTRGAPRVSPPPATSDRGELSARAPYTAADIHFMAAMIGHHAQAIRMARLASTHGASAPVRVLAERIASGQQDEIATMQQWLRDRQQPVPEAGATGMKMMNGDEHEMLMPGMLTDAQMEQLDQARGAEFDRLFLTFMIQHHRGAVAMVKQLFGTHGAVQDETVFKFASDVNVDQSTEIARMQRMLADLIFEERSP